MPEQRRARRGVAIALLGLLAALLAIAALPQARAAMGGPDGGGYYYVDTASGGPALSMADLNVSTALSITDESPLQWVPLPPGFFFDYYGARVNGVAVSDNGFLSFSNTTNSFNDVAIPFTNTPNHMVAGFWDDLEPRARAGVVRHKTLGSEPTRTFVVEWASVRHFGTPSADTGTLRDPSPDAAICLYDADGNGGASAGDLVYMSPDGSDTSVEAGDIRLMDSGTFAKGSVVLGSSSDFARALLCRTYTVAYYDVNGNGAYDSTDHVYLGYDQNGAGPIQPTSSTGDWWVRITPVGSTSSGTFLFGSDNDYLSFGVGRYLTGAEFAWVDLDGSSTFGAPDAAYITSTAVATGDPVPAPSVRLHHPSFAFGTRTVSGIEGGMLVDPSPDVAICAMDADGGSSVASDGFYLSMDGDDSTVEIGDIRLVAFMGRAAGSVVLASHSDFALPLDCQPYTVAYHDVNSNGRYDAGDHVFIGFNRSTTSLVQASAQTGDWWIRLTATNGGAAGTPVLTGHADLTSFGQGSLLTGAEFARDDVDGNGVWNSGDTGYVTSRAVASGDYVPDDSVRVHHATLAFGSIVDAVDANTVNFQIKLLEASDEIEVHWASAESDGGLHTVGIEDATGANGLQYERASTSLVDKAVRFTKTSPLLTTISPEPDGAWQTGARTYTFTCRRPYSSNAPCIGASIDVYDNGNLLVTLTTNAAGQAFYSHEPAADGVHVLSWRARQSGFPNEVLRERTTYFDRVAPSAWANTTCSSPGANGWCLNSIDYTGEASDVTSGLDSVSCSLGFAIGCAGTFVGERSATFRVDACDNAALCSPASVPVLIDRFAPSGWANLTCASAGDGDWCLTDVTLDGEGSDGMSGVATVACELDGASAACEPPLVTSQGRHRWFVNVTDVAGRLTTTSRLFGIDKTTPSASWSKTCNGVSVGVWCPASVTYSGTSSDAQSGLAPGYPACTRDGVANACAGTQSGDGTYTFVLSTRDNAGRATSASTLVRIDTTPPAAIPAPTCAAGFSPEGWCDGNIVVDLTTTDATSGIASSVCSVNNVTRTCADFTISTDGAYYVQQAHTDNAGNVRNQTAFVGRDVSAPTVTLASSCPADWCAADVAFTLSYSDAGVVRSATCSDNNATRDCTSFTVTADGGHYVQAEVVDLAGNVRNVTLFGGRDTVAPALTLTKSCPADWCAGDVAFTITGLDATSGVQSGACSDNNATRACEPFTVTTDGGHYVQAHLADMAGNVANRTLFGGRDTVAPAITLTRSCASDWCAADVAFTLARSDATSGEQSAVCSDNNATRDCSTFTVTTDGGHYVQAHVIDKAGNVANRTLFGGRDAVAPLAIPAPTCAAGFGVEGWCDGDIVVDLTTTDATSGLASSVCSVNNATRACTDLTIAADGAYYVQQHHVDKAGNARNHTTFVGRDTVAPALSVVRSCASDWCAADVTFTISRSDGLSGELSAVCSDNNVTRACTSFTVTSDGGHYVQAHVVDKAGNAANRTRFAGRDTVAPASVPAPACAAGFTSDGWCDGDIVVDLTTTDATSGLASSVCSIDNATRACADLTLTTDGAYYIQQEHRDLAGNVRNQTAFVGRDTVAPTLTLGASCAAEWCSSDISFTITHSDASGARSAVCSHNNATRACTSFSVNTDGGHYVQAEVTDLAGNVRNATLFAGRDTLAPVLTLTRSCAGDWCAADVSFTLAPSDATSGVASAACSDNNATRDCTSFAVTVDGGHYVQANVVDKAGNVANRTLFAGRDTVAPALTLTRSCGSDWCSSDVAFTLGHSDATSGVASAVCSDSNATRACTTFTVTSDGAHYVQMEAVDKAGNVANRTLFGGRDTVAPAVTLTRSCPSDWCAADLTFTLARSDATSGEQSAVCSDNNATRDCSSFTVNTDGGHYVQASVVDKAGNAANRTLFAGRDTVAPALTLTSSCASDWCPADVTFTLGRSDATSGEQSAVCSDNNATRDCSSFTVTSDSGHYVQAHVVDKAGNAANRTLFAGRDATPPALALTRSCATDWCAADVTFTLARSDATSGEQSAVCSDNNATRACSSFTITTDGGHYVQAHVVDKAGNVANRTLFAGRDVVPPAAIPGPTCAAGFSAEGWCNGDIVVDLTTTDATSGLASSVCSVGNATRACADLTIASDGAYYVQQEHKDKAGNVRNQTAFVGRDVEAPTLTLASSCPVDWCAADVTFTIAYSDALGIRSAVCSDNNATRDCASFTVTSDGAHYVQAQVTDAAGHVRNATLFGGRDTVAPALALTSSCQAEWCAADVAFTLTVSDATSDLASAVCSDNNATRGCSSFAVATDGGHYVQAHAVDKAGNVANRTLFRGRDTVAPLALPAPACGGTVSSGWCRGDVTVDLTTSDATSGLASSVCSVDNVVRDCSDFTIATDGSRLVQQEHKDRAGNTRNQTALVRRDVTPPALTLTRSCPADWCASDVTFTIARSDATSGVASAVCSDNNATRSCAPFTVTTDGGHYVQMHVIDVAGNVANATLFAGRDATPPALTLTRSCATDWCAADVTFTLARSDATSGEHSAVCSDNNATRACSSFTVTTDGGHYVQAHVVDKAGNVANRTLFGGRDTAAPVGAIVAGCPSPGGGGWCLGPIDVSASATDVTGGSPTLTCSLDGAPSPCQTQVATTGVHTFALAATDRAGNTGTLEETLRVDRLAPTATLNAPCSAQGGGYCRQPTRSYAWNLADVGSGTDASRATCTLGGTTSPCSGTIAGEGAHALAIALTDVAGNPGASSAQLRIDSVAPSAWVNVTCADMRASGWCRDASAAYAMAASDATSGVASLGCARNAATVACAGTLPSPGRYTLVASAQDVAGNLGQLGLPFGVDLSRPALSATAPAAGKIALSWTTPGAVGAITGYRLQRAPDGDASAWTTIYEGSATAFTDQGLPDRATFHYRVNSSGEAGPSDLSLIATATTLGLPTPPRELTATPAGAGVQLTWLPPTDDGGAPLAGYVVYRRSSSGVSNEATFDVPPSQTSFDDTPPVTGEALGEFVYAVTARNAAGQSARSNEVTFQYAEDQPPVPNPRQPVSSAVPFQRDWERTTPPATGAESGRVVLASPDGLILYTVGTRTVGANVDFVVDARDAVTGEPRWSAPRTFGGTGSSLDRPFAATLSPDGARIYATGQFGGAYGTIAVDATDGALLWQATHAFEGGNSVARAIRASDTIVVVTGSVPGGDSTDVLTLALRTADGGALWQQRFSTVAADDGVALALADGVAYVGATSNGDLLTVGYRETDGALAFGPRRAGGNDQETLAGMTLAGPRLVLAGTVRDASGEDILVVAYDRANGAQAWIARYDSTPLLDPTERDDRAAAIGASPDGSQVFVAGRSSTTGRGLDAPTIAFNAATGTNLWAHMRDAGDDGDDEALAIAVSRDGLRVYVAGTSYSAATRSIDAAVWALGATGGELAWNDTLSHDGRDAARSIVVASDARVYALGDVGAPTASALALLAYGPVTTPDGGGVPSSDASVFLGPRIEEASDPMPSASTISRRLERRP